MYKPKGITLYRKPMYCNGIRMRHIDGGYAWEYGATVKGRGRTGAKARAEFMRATPYERQAMMRAWARGNSYREGF